MEKSSHRNARPGAKKKSEEIKSQAVPSENDNNNNENRQLSFSVLRDTSRNFSHTCMNSAEELQDPSAVTKLYILQWNSYEPRSLLRAQRKEYVSAEKG